MKLPRFNFNFEGIHLVFPLIGVFGIYTVTIFPFSFYRHKWAMQHQMNYNRETIHIQQQLECGLAGLLLFIILGFLINWFIALPALFLYWILYGLFFVMNIINGYYWRRANRSICFKREANQYANIYAYWKIRRPFSWIKYINFE